MKKSHGLRAYGICTALILTMTLILTACGSSSPAGAGSSPAPAAEESTAAAEPAAAAENAADNGSPAGTAESQQPEAAAPEEASASEAAGGTVYDDNGIVIKVTRVEEGGSYTFLFLDITSNRSDDVGFDLYPMKINDALIVSEGAFDQLNAGDTISEEIGISKDAFDMVGITSIQSIRGYLTLNDLNNYEPIMETELVTLVAGGSGDAPAVPEHSDQIIYDSNGVRISYLGKNNDEYYGNRPVFLASNDSDVTVYVSSPYMEETIDGRASEDRYLALDGATLPAGTAALLCANVLSSTTYEAADYETLDFEFSVNGDAEGWYTQLVPTHVTADAGTFTVTAEDPYYSETALSMMEYDERQAEEAALDAAREANAEEIQDPFIAKTGFLTYQIGTSYNNATVTALVYNPNERTYLYDLRLECKAYDKDGNLLAETKPYYVDKFTIAPGEELPYQMSVNKIELGVEVADVDIVITEYRSFNEIDLETEREDRGLMMKSEDILFENAMIVEGYREGKTILDRYEAFYSGTLINNGEAADKIYLLPVLYNADGDIILSSRSSENDLAAGESREIKHNFDVAIYELPGLDHAALYVLK